MRKAFLTAAALLVAAVFSRAQEIRDIETVVKLQRNGDAQVIQKWDMTVVEGTEWYIPIDNPGKSYIHDFQVSENGQAYENEGRGWKSDRSLEAKTRRCGIVEKGNDNIELCWGQGAYGDHVYTISYIIDKLVQSYPECDGFHWHFLNDEWYAKPKHASIRLENQTGGDPWFWASADSCNVRYWGFGMEGNSWLEDGAICFESTESFRRQSFFSALVQFDKGLFQPAVQADGSFEALKKEAMEGSDYGENEEKDFMDYVGIALFALILIGLPVFLVGFLIYLGLRRVYRRTTGKRYNKEIFGRSKIDTWCRDIPFDANPSILFSLLQSGDYLHPDKNKSFSNVVSAYFLKWIQEGMIRVEKDPKKEDRVNLRFVQDAAPAFQDKMEERIYKGAVEASGDLLLEADEFKKWSYKHDSEAASWPGEAVYSGRKTWTAASQQERCKAIEFKNYLEDFTLVEERSAPEVGLWKKYMIMAASLGIADKVAKNFEKLFPNVMEQYARESNMYDSATTYYVIQSLNRSSSSMMTSAVNRQAEREAARTAAQRRSSGGGGSISFGGGGGGFGGGHGGGSR